MKHIPSSFEALESRIAPAAVFVDASSLKVTFAGGAIKVSPLVAGEAIQVHIEQTPDGDLLISDLLGDDDLEETANFDGTIRSLSVYGSAGDDEISMAFLAPDGLRAKTLVSTGAGVDSVRFTEGVLVGALSVGGTGELDFAIGSLPEVLTQVKGAVVAKMNSGSFSLSEGGRIGNLSVLGGYDYSVLGLVTGNATFTSKLGASLTLGGESNTGAAVTGYVKFTGYNEADSLSLGQVFVSGGVMANLGHGDNSIFFGDGAIVGGATSINTLNGNDSVTFGSNATGPTVFGKTTIKLGNSTVANELNIVSGFFSGGLSVTGGAQADIVNVASTARLYNAFSLALGNGANTTVINTLDALNTFTYTGGANVDLLTFGTVGRGTAIGKVNLGAGDDNLVFGGGIEDLFNGLNADGGTGTNSLTASMSGSGLTVINF